MPRSQHGLEGAGEWENLQSNLPDFKNKKVLDLGCGYGWHCKYAVQQGAKEVVGIDASKKMIEKAEAVNHDS
ncbi:class I SAM-dependent methyltransferase, partial [Escherichia coli]|uniref:class I SAM-dependent methyltransferase n=2 Tax=Bacteria TaxID=2 RepID=UPI0012997BB3